MNKNIRILITGATGLVGSYVARLLDASGYQSLSGTRRKTSRMDLLGQVAKRMDWHTGDLTDPSFCREIGTNHDCIIHCAAFISFHRKDYHKLIAINQEATANLVNAALDQKVDYFIHVSSIAALGRSEDRETLSERSIWRRSSLNSDYAVSKFLGEMEVWRGYAEGLPAAIVNPSTTLGGGFWGSGSLEILDKVWGGLRFYPKGGTGFVDVRDIAKAILTLLEKRITGRRYIISAENLSYQELFSRVAAGMGKQPPNIMIRPWMTGIAWRGARLVSSITGRKPYIERDVARLTQNTYVYVNQRSKEELGLAYTDLDETIRETTAAYLESKEKKEPFARLPFKPEKSIVS